MHVQSTSRHCLLGSIVMFAAVCNAHFHSAKRGRGSVVLSKTFSFTCHFTKMSLSAELGTLRKGGVGGRSTLTFSMIVIYPFKNGWKPRDSPRLRHSSLWVSNRRTSAS